VPRQPQPPLSVPEAADLFRVLGGPTRLRLLLLLAARGEATVGALIEAAGLSQPALSGHLLRLRLAGVVAARREGKRVYYRLSSPLATDLLRRVCGGWGRGNCQAFTRFSWSPAAGPADRTPGGRTAPDYPCKAPVGSCPPGPCCCAAPAPL
jgi:DNA-binding transcriptional ArsR family regulator